MAVLKAVRTWLVVAAALHWGGPTPAGQTAPSLEYRVKAVFLFNFAQFVDWPLAAFPDSQTPVVIGVLGDDPFGPLLDETVRGETLAGRPFEVRRYRRADEIKACHILFISQSESDRLEEILAGLKSRPTLTVGDGEGFSLRGGMVRFVTEKNRVRLRINLEAVQAANLTISSKLLRSAEIVTSRKQ
ncbi:MAG TPA: YfiR family protein [Gemmatimonadales bacterium]|nr:YfiR family protein [Gemmatimonadales bacterium]